MAHNAKRVFTIYIIVICLSILPKSYLKVHLVFSVKIQKVDLGR